MLWFKILLTTWFTWGAIKTLSTSVDMSYDDKYEKWAILVAVVISLAVYGLMIMGVWIWI